MLRKRAIDLLTVVVNDIHSGKSGVVVPEACRTLWRWFDDLSQTRTYHAAGPNPISYQEIIAYGLATRTPLRHEDIHAIRSIDNAWIQAVFQHKMKAGGLGSRSGPEMNAAVFDAVFG